MRHKIFKDGRQVNSIVGGSAFVEDFCRKHGYTSEPMELPEPAAAAEPEAPPTLEQRVEALERTVAQLREELQAALEIKHGREERV